MLDRRSASIGNSKRLVAAITTLFVLLATAYSMINPAWESPDELGHYRFIRHLVVERSLPLLKEREPGENHQPPLYYVLAATSVLSADVFDPIGSFRPNPNFRMAGRGGDDVNAARHSTPESFPYRGQALALHLARWVSVLLGACTVLLTMRLGFEVAPDRPAVGLLAGTLAGGVPQFLFISGSVNNDNLVTLLGTAAILQMVRLLARPNQFAGWLMLGVIAALALLAKLSGGVFGLLAGLTLIACAARTRSLRLFLSGLVALAVPALIIDAWWFLRNNTIYGDPLALELYRIVFAANSRQGSLGWADIGQMFSTQFRSFWGLFGWMYVDAPSWYYAAARFFTILGALGLVGSVVTNFPGLKRLRRDALALLAVAVVVQELYIVGTLFECNASCYQGRYVFPVIAPLAVVFAVGLLGMLPRASEKLALVAMAVPLAACAVYLLLGVIRPAYEAVTEPNWVAWTVPNRVDVSFDGQIRLVGYSTAGDPDSGNLVVSLYWQAQRRPDFDYTAFVHLVDANGVLISQQDVVPGADRGYSPSVWEMGDILVQRHVLREARALPASATLSVGLYNWQTGQRLMTSRLGSDPTQSLRLDP